MYLEDSTKEIIWIQQNKQEKNGENYMKKFMICTGHFIMFSVITNIYNKKTKGPTLMEFFTATGKLKKFFFFDN